MILVVLAGIAGVAAGIGLSTARRRPRPTHPPRALLLGARDRWPRRRSPPGASAPAWELPAYLYFAAVSVPLAIIDLRTLRLPNVLTLSAYPDRGRPAPAARASSATAGPPTAARCWPGQSSSRLFVVLHLVNPSGMGLGDVKLAGPMGALLGWLSWQAAMVGVVIGFVLVAVVGIAMILARRADRKSALPFGPFMLAGAWVAILVPAAGSGLSALRWSSENTW